jgi:hypothetical protein
MVSIKSNIHFDFKTLLNVDFHGLWEPRNIIQGDRFKEFSLKRLSKSSKQTKANHMVECKVYFF